MPLARISCPFCKEAVRADAIKCRWCQSALLPGADLRTPLPPPAAPTGKVTYVVDEGIVRFGKFAAAVLAIFVLVGTYAFGLKLDATVEKLRVAQADLEAESRRLGRARAEATKVMRSVAELEALARRGVQAIEADRARMQNLLRVSVIEVSLSPRGRDLLAQLREAAPEKFRSGAPGNAKLWRPGSTIRVRFLDGTPTQQQLFRDAAAAWLANANLRVVYPTTGGGDVRVSFAGSGSWSYVGTDALAVSQNEPTVNLGFADGRGIPPPNYLHEIGHMLGLVHEHGNPTAMVQWNRPRVYALLTGAPNFMTRPQIDQMLTAEAYPGARPFDRGSIMVTPLPGTFFLDGRGFEWPRGLSSSDMAYIAALYPRQQG